MSPAALVGESFVTIVGIRFRPAGRIYYFDPQRASYTTGQYVIVETVRGIEAGRVVIAPKKDRRKRFKRPFEARAAPGKRRRTTHDALLQK